MKKIGIDGANIAEALTRARGLSQKLNEAADSLNVEIAAAEAALVALKLGVSASVDISGGEDMGPHFELLSFQKHGDRWRLVYETGDGEDERSWETIPLQNASRDTRKEALEHLPALLDALITTAERELEELAHAVTVSGTFRAALAAGASKSPPTVAVKGGAK